MTGALWLDPALRCLRAPNPGPLTGPGTNTYIVGRGAVAVIDPGPQIESHLQAILAALGPGETVARILVTHSHRDHSPLAAALSQATGAPVCAFGDSLTGRSAVMERLAADSALGGGEGVDPAFRPDITLPDGARIAVGAEQLQALWTPGHFGNHLCFLWRGHAFSGDHVMGWATTLVSPPDGDLTAFMDSLDRLEALAPQRLFPGHGDPVEDGIPRIRALRQHRLHRKAEILKHMTQGPATIASLTRAIYTDTPPHLHTAAARNVLAHLIDLTETGRVDAHPAPCADATFRLRKNS